MSRGGGCNACHLNYSGKTKNNLKRYLASNKTELPQFHSSTDIFVNDTHCFGCHSRLGRISTNYMDLQETLLDIDEVVNMENYSVLEDQRVYKQLEEDVHHSMGLLCIDVIHRMKSWVMARDMLMKKMLLLYNVVIAILKKNQILFLMTL